MKSFKLISAQLVSDDKTLTNIELKDGLIINKEDGSSTWIIEAFTPESSFEQIKDQLPQPGGEANLQVIITKKENDSAYMTTVLNQIVQMDGFVSLLFVGRMQRSKSKYAELLLEDLISQGIVGDELIESFKENLRTRPALSEHK